jgi:18S rRNA (adenine1779-N6/adenine1780-N6)-dimethyltransferase
MFQREFAMRLVARPGTALWSRLSANVQLYAKVDNVMNVSRNDFRPPPQVESSVVRLVPIDPPPPVRFEEFDGMNRIIFSRPNKTVRANLQSKGVEKMLEQNRRTWFSVNGRVNKALKSFSALESDVALLQTMEDDGPMRSLVEKVLNDSGFADVRAAKMSVDDLLKFVDLASPATSCLTTRSFYVRLLSAFHDVGVHFS